MIDPKSLFHGIAVLIDDEVEVKDSEISKLASQIELEHCHVIKLEKIPDDDAKLDNLNEVAFFILDWNLRSTEIPPGVQIPSFLGSTGQEMNIKFLEKIRDKRFAPVFIFTNENADDIKRILLERNLLKDDSSDYIFVKSKKDVLNDGIFTVLAEWIKSHPSAYVLKCWEKEYSKARNAFFVEFYGKSHLWPAVLWKTYQADGVSAPAELTSMISRNILSRLAPVQFNSEIVLPSSLTDSAFRSKNTEIREVLEGERFIKNDSLQTEPSLGDVFKCRGKYYINIRPECDCVSRDKPVEELDLYLIRGDKITDNNFHKTFDYEFGNFIDKETTGTVFSMHDGNSVCFQFKSLHIKKWKECKEKRIGRLIPPYSTKLQQRFAAFIQRVGFSKIPSEIVPPNPNEHSESSKEENQEVSKETCNEKTM